MLLSQLKEVSREYLVRVIGACFDHPNNCLVTEYCPRGSLQDVLENETLKLDGMMKCSLLHDLTKVSFIKICFLNILCYLILVAIKY